MFQGVSQEINAGFPKQQKEEPSPNRTRTRTRNVPVENRVFSSHVTTKNTLYAFKHDSSLGCTNYESKYVPRVVSMKITYRMLKNQSLHADHPGSEIKLLKTYFILSLKLEIQIFGGMELSCLRIRKLLEYIFYKHDRRIRTTCNKHSFLPHKVNSFLYVCMRKQNVRSFLIGV